MSKRSDATRERLFSAAVDLIGEQGYHGTTVDDIVERAGVAKGTVYYHFSGKEDLFQAMLTDGLERLSSAFREQVEISADPVDALDGLVRAELTFIIENQAFSKLLMSELWRGDRVWREAVVMLREDYVSCVVSVLRRGIDSGAFRPDLDPHWAGPVVFGSVITAALDWLMFQPERPLEEVVVETSALVKHGVWARR